MKLLENNLGVVLISLFLLTGCAKDEEAHIEVEVIIPGEEIIEPEEAEETTCTFLSEGLTIEPVCSFDPSLFPTVHFPVRILHEGIVVTHPDYSFEWSSDAEFNGSAISLSYEMLPLTATVIEISSECTATATITSEYWD